jgi:hypothetical protein
MSYCSGFFAFPIFAAFTVFSTACAPVQTVIPIENQFSPVDPSKYKDEQQKGLGRQLAVNECKSKSMIASAAVEKTIAGEVHSRENQLRARDKAAEMFAASFTSCMNGYGYIRNYRQLLSPVRIS